MQVAELAFIMANMGKADHGKQVYDPFVGTGDSRLMMHQPTVFVCANTACAMVAHHRQSAGGIGSVRSHDAWSGH